MRQFTTKEYYEMHRGMEDFHGVFSQMWSLGKPSFDKNIPTAAVGFDKKGECIAFKFNPDFWDSLTTKKKKFVIAHECLHVMYHHGKRMKKLNKGKANKVADVVINHGLVDHFGFDIDDIDPAELPTEEMLAKNPALNPDEPRRQYCWRETVFKNPEKVPENKSMEFYYKLLEQGEGQEGGDGEGAGTGELVDGHEGLEGFSDEDLEDLADAINETLSDEEKESLKDKFKEMEKGDENGNEQGDKPGGQLAGSMAGNMMKTLNIKKVPKKKKWETVIRKWSDKYLKDDLVNEEQWAMVNRRFVELEKSDLMLPTEHEVEALDEQKCRIKVWFFQDTSGSCSHLVNRFFKAALSLPPERFDVKMHCFDTRVYETDLKSQKLYGFGGTTFTCIEEYIQQNKGKEYPKAVFVITDGYGDRVEPEKPQNWFWFIDGDDYLLPKNSNIHQLKDFE